VITRWRHLAYFQEAQLNNFFDYTLLSFASIHFSMALNRQPTVLSLSLTCAGNSLSEISRYINDLEIPSIDTNSRILTILSNSIFIS
jgi:hypothetical protein